MTPLEALRQARESLQMAWDLTDKRLPIPEKQRDQWTELLTHLRGLMMLISFYQQRPPMALIEITGQASFKTPRNTRFPAQDTGLITKHPT